MQRCGVCHTLFHKGGKVGPNLTAYQRDDLGTMLTSILDPGAEIREGFVNYIARTKSGRSLGGFLVDNDAVVVTLRGSDGQDVRVRRDDLLELKASPISLMPEGLLGGLSDQEVRDLFAYLRIPQPITR
jgi:putative heme-binding domain-containing protein